MFYIRPFAGHGSPLRTADKISFTSPHIVAGKFYVKSLSWAFDYPNVHLKDKWNNKTIKFLKKVNWVQFWRTNNLGLNRAFYYARKERTYIGTETSYNL